MKRTSLSLTDDLALVLEREARRRGTSVSDVARQALAERFGLAEHERRALPFGAIGRSGGGPGARDIERVLDAEWTPDRDR